MSSTLPINQALCLYCTGQGTIVDNVIDAHMSAARTSLVSLISNRMYADTVPQTHHPADGDLLYFSKSSARADVNMRGNDGLRFTTFTIDGQSTTAIGRDVLSSTLFTALQGYSGTVTYDGNTMTIGNCICESEDEDYVLEEEAGNDLIYGFTQTWEIAHEVA